VNFKKKERGKRKKEKGKMKKAKYSRVNIFEYIPQDVIYFEIFQFLGFREVLNLSITSKFFYRLCEYRLVWKTLINVHFKKERFEKLKGFFPLEIKGGKWKDIFRKMWKISKTCQQHYYSISLDFTKIKNLCSKLDIKDIKEFCDGGHGYLNGTDEYILTDLCSSISEKFEYIPIDVILSNSDEAASRQLIFKSLREKIHLFQQLRKRIIHDYSYSTYYYGETVDNKPHGIGKEFSRPHGKTIYEGDWSFGKRHGKGICYILNGDTYEGYWRKGKRHGKGKLFYRYIEQFEGELDGSDDIPNERYEGDWLNDKRHGRGTYFFYGGKYEGEWKNDKWHGRGILIDRDGSKYEGEWKYGELHGKGIEFYSATDLSEFEAKHLVYFDMPKKKYEGDWKKGQWHGNGIYYYLNGDRYEGKWKNYRKNGKGKFFFANGDSYEGEWKDGKLIGKGNIFIKNSKNGFGEIEWINGAVQYMKK
jgi:hypothetical protein